jgi:hypothetical protein
MRIRPARYSAPADLRACIWGAVAASTACVLFMAAVYLLDIHGIGSLIAKSDGGLSWADVLIPIVTFGLIGFAIGPAVAGSGPHHD